MGLRRFIDADARSARRIEATAKRLGYRSSALADAERLEREAPLFEMGEVQNSRAHFPDTSNTARPR
jgi:hypothetical protein